MASPMSCANAYPHHSFVYAKLYSANQQNAIVNTLQAHCAAGQTYHPKAYGQGSNLLKDQT
jgi:hypothetical protein